MRKPSRIIAVILSLTLIMSTTSPVMADTPYLGYTYNFWGVTVPAPVSYIPTRTISAVDISPELGSFSNPMDMSVDRNGLIYLLDTGNNRVVVFCQELSLKQVIYGFYGPEGWEAFNNPNGVFVCYNMRIYVADTDNRRVVILDLYGDFISQICNPDLTEFADEVDFRPLRVVADRAGRVYVIVAHVIEGIMRFNEDGQFFGYFGTIHVRLTPMDVFWRMVSTPEQRARQRRFVPTEYTGMDVDEYGFVFATHSDVLGGGDQVMRLNPRGVNVLRNFNPNTNINGDQWWSFGGPSSGPSNFIGIVARENGKYSALDSTRGRVYTYDSDGNLLYVFGGEGNIMGMSRRPVALEAIGDHMMILDSLRGRIIYFEPTEYGRLINEAIALRYQGDEAGSVEIWRQLAVMDENLTLAFTGIGRAHIIDGNYALAMDYLRRGMDLRYYSIALGHRRQQILEDNLPMVLTIGLALALILVGRSVYTHIKNGKEVDA